MSNKIQVSTPENDRRVAWVQRCLKRELEPVECAMVAIVCDAVGCGPYDLPSWKTRLRKCGHGCRFSLDVGRELATIDSAVLTRLVFSAHDHCARVTVGGCPVKRIEIRVWLREREGDFSSRHPSLEKAVEGWRDRRPL